LTRVKREPSVSRTQRSFCHSAELGPSLTLTGNTTTVCDAGDLP
jgi:hypothetical protein